MSCERCGWYKRGGAFTCVWPWGEWDVNAAEKLVAGKVRAGEARLITVKWQTLARYARRDGWLDARNYHEPHVAHVDGSKPGIMGTATHSPGRRRFLIEGQHRAIQCLRAKRDFSFYLLSKPETDGITIRRRRHPRETRKLSRNASRYRRASRSSRRALAA